MGTQGQGRSGVEKGEVMVVQRRGGWGQRKTQPPSTHCLTVPPTHTHTHTHTHTQAELTGRKSPREQSGVRVRDRKGSRKKATREAGPLGKHTCHHLLLWVWEGGPEHPWGNQDPWAGLDGRATARVTSPATHSSTFAWEIPWAEEPGTLQSMES